VKGVTKEWALTLAFSVLTVLALGLGLTWVNIERVDMAYELKRLQTEIDAQEALISKLEVERNTLLTPERLRVLAVQYGLNQARPGQIRRLSLTGDELASPVIKSAPPAADKPKKTEQNKDGAAKPAKKAKKNSDTKNTKEVGRDTSEPAKDRKKTL
jgi:cell division protein FtsL